MEWFIATMEVFLRRTSIMVVNTTYASMADLQAVVVFLACWQRKRRNCSM